MREQNRDELLNDYLDGVLSAGEVEAIEAELERDPAFRAEERALQALIAEAARLPKGIVPRRDLWDGIDARLSERAPKQASRRAFARVSQGLLAVAAAALIFIAGMWYARTLPTNVQSPVASVDDQHAPPAIQFAAYKEITAEYAGVRTTLREALDEARPNLAPETVTVIDDSLAVIDRAIRDIEVALDKDPGNRALMQSLVAVYDQEVGLLRQVTHLAEGPGETNA